MAEDAPDRSHYSLFIATPCYACQICEGYLHSMLRLQMLLITHNIFFKVKTVGNESLITRARNNLVAEFMGDKRFTHLLFIDADLKFDPELVIHMLDMNENVVAGCYVKKGFEWDNVKEFCYSNKRLPEAEEMPNILASWNLNVWHNKIADGKEQTEVKGGFVRVLDAPTGFMMISQSTFDIMKKHYPQTFECDNDTYINEFSLGNFHTFFDTMICPDSKRYLSEDYAFCRKWQAVGGKVWLNFTSAFTHYGTHGFEGNPYFMMSEMLGLKEEKEKDEYTEATPLSQKA